MRRLFVMGLLVTLVAIPAVVLAQPESTLPVSGTLSGGTINGTTTIGGVTGTVTSSGGSWTMTVDGVLFASGTYTCGGGSCIYTGTVAGSTKTLHFTISSTTGTNTTTATGFSTHGAWVSTVAHWAGTNAGALTTNGFTPGSVVSSAAKDPASVHGNSGGGGDHGHEGDHGKP
jgi:hypothetical protein